MRINAREENHECVIFLLKYVYKYLKTIDIS